MKENYIIKVAPIIPLPVYKTQIFSYNFEKNISSGTLVKIPFGYKYLRGIVISCELSKSYQKTTRLKDISEIVQEAHLEKKQIKLARLIADYYVCPLGVVLKSMIPQKVKFKKTKKEIESVGLKINFRQKNKAVQILKEKCQKIVLAASRATRREILLSLVGLIKNEHGQCLYLVSEILAVWSAADDWSKYFLSSEIAVFWSGMSKGKYYEEWLKVKTGRARIIISTKIGVFLPFQDLKFIFVNDGQDISYKQWDMNPRYSAVKVCDFISELYVAKLIYAGASPSLSNYLLARDKQVRLLKTGIKKPGYKFKIISLYQEKNSRDFPITKDLHQLLSKFLNEKKKILLFTKRRGYSSYTVCKKCANIFRCPKCERALVYFENTEDYRCLHCSFKADVLSACPTCGACQFSHQGIGIDQIEKKIKRLFPSVKVEKITRDISKSERGRKNILKAIDSGNIILGTQVVLKTGDIKQFDLVVFVNFDDLGNISAFNTNEILWAHLSMGGDLVKGGGVFAVQTYLTDNDMLRNFSRGEAQAFYEKEALIRKKLNLPPFFSQVLLSYRGKSKAKVDAEAKKMFDLLQRVSNNKIEIGEPYEPLIAKKRELNYKNLLVKVEKMSKIKNLPIYSALAALGKGWQIDVDPISSS